MKAQLDKEVQFITDRQGNRTAAVIPIERWAELMQQYDTNPFLPEEALEIEVEQSEDDARRKRNKEVFKKELLQSFKDVKAHQEGRMTLKSARELLDEL